MGSRSLGVKGSSVLRQKSLYFDCHSGLDPESNIPGVDSRWSSSRWKSGRE